MTFFFNFYLDIHFYSYINTKFYLFYNFYGKSKFLVIYWYGNRFYISHREIIFHQLYISFSEARIIEKHGYWASNLPHSIVYHLQNDMFGRQGEFSLFQPNFSIRMWECLNPNQNLKPIQENRKPYEIEYF
jgi:hypothetical protein